MTALVVLLALVVALLIVLVIGVLRTHAEVLRRLHELGAGVFPEDQARSSPTAIDLTSRVAAGVSAPRSGIDGAPLVVSHLQGSSPRGSTVSVALSGESRLTLLAFLSSGCATCGDFWRAWREGAAIDLGGPVAPRVVIVTKSAENEHPNAVVALAPEGITTIMSDLAGATSMSPPAHTSSSSTASAAWWGRGRRRPLISCRVC